MPVRCNIADTSELPASDVQNKESTVVQQVRDALNNATEEDLNKIEEMVVLRKNGMTPVAAEDGSLVLFLWCCERSGLDRLHDWLVNGTLQAIVESLFSRLLKTSKDNTLPVVIHWKEDDYDRCVKYFNTTRGMQT